MAKTLWNWRATFPEKLGEVVTTKLAQDGTGRIDVTFADGSKTRVVRWAVRVVADHCVPKPKKKKWINRRAGAGRFRRDKRVKHSIQFKPPTQ